jgi:hypothetical protein
LVEGSDSAIGYLGGWSKVLLVMSEDTFPSVVVALVSFGRFGVLPSAVLKLD